VLASRRWRDWNPPAILQKSQEHQLTKPTKATSKPILSVLSVPTLPVSEINAPSDSIPPNDPEVARRPAMPAGVRLIRWEPKAAPVRLSKCSTVTDIDKFVHSTLRQVEARLYGKDWLAGNWTLSTLLARLEACGCCVALDNPHEALQ